MHTTRDGRGDGGDGTMEEAAMLAIKILDLRIHSKLAYIAKKATRVLRGTNIYNDNDGGGGPVGH